MLGQRGLLYIGDRKMGAKTTRAQIAAKEDFYLVPLSNPGEVPHLLAECVDSVVDGDRPATLIFNKTSDSETPQLVSAGYETHREQSHTLAGGQPYSWKERVLVIRSHQTALKQIATLEHRFKSSDRCPISPHSTQRAWQTTDSDRSRVEKKSGWPLHPLWCQRVSQLYVPARRTESGPIHRSRSWGRAPSKTHRHNGPAIR